MAKAQRIPEGVTTVVDPDPVRATSPAALLLACVPISLMLIHIEQEKARETKAPVQV
jgi:hypothetical protein